MPPRKQGQPEPDQTDVKPVRRQSRDVGSTGDMERLDQWTDRVNGTQRRRRGEDESIMDDRWGDGRQDDKGWRR